MMKRFKALMLLIMMLVSAVVFSGCVDNNPEFPAPAPSPSPGTLDATFGFGGKVTTFIGASNDAATALGIQSDGKILAAGFSFNGANNDFALVRYNTDGNLDASLFGFGTGGKVTTPIGSFDDVAHALAIQSDGRIVVAGFASNGIKNDFALVRYNADGNLDLSFGIGGKVTTPIGSFDDVAHALAIQLDGKIVAAGYSATSATNKDFALVRYNTDGNLDLSFGIAGKVITPVGIFDDVARSLAIQLDGKIVAAGHASNGVDDDFALVRYNTDGILDAPFGLGGDGKVTTPIGSFNDIATALRIQLDGKIVAAGHSFTGVKNNFALVRYNTNGVLDAPFGLGGDGKVTTSVGSFNDIASALRIQSDGKIVAAGHSSTGVKNDFALVRYNTDGTLDAPFGIGGKVTTLIGSSNDIAAALGIQSDGKIVAAGHSSNGVNDDFALVRYWP
jgi:uncharacterized delta-60 repeat protein